MTVLILESGWSGHRMVYIQYMARALADHGERFTLVLPQGATRAPEFEQHLSGLVDSKDVLEAPDRRAMMRIAAMRASADSARMVVLPHADPFLNTPVMAYVSRHAKLRALIMQHPRWELLSIPRREPRRIKLLAKDAAISAWRRFPNVEVLCLAAPSPDPPPLTFGLRSVPDPILIGDIEETLAEGRALRQRLQMHDEVFWFGVVGGITDRKNVRCLVEALSSSEWQVPVGIALLGPYHTTSFPLEQLKAACQAAGILLRLDDRLLSNEEVNASVAALDCVATLYSTHSPNSTVGKVGALGVQLIAAGSPTYLGHVRAMTGLDGSHLSVEAVRTQAAQAIAGARYPASRPPTGPAAFIERMLG